MGKNRRTGRPKAVVLNTKAGPWFRKPLLNSLSYGANELRIVPKTCFSRPFLLEVGRSLKWTADDQAKSWNSTVDRRQGNAGYALAASSSSQGSSSTEVSDLSTVAANTIAATTSPTPMAQARW